MPLELVIHENNGKRSINSATALEVIISNFSWYTSKFPNCSPLKQIELQFFILKKKENKIRAKQAKEKDLAGRKSAQSASDRKAKPVTLPPMPFAKGGSVKKYNRGGYANCGASVKGTQKK